ncbi:hypothetical protein OESDEN_17174, partial [Oesophagostomum dentatum]
MESDDTDEKDNPGIQFDYVAIGQMLFDVGKKPETISRRRKKLYDLVKRFDVAAKGGDPYRFEAPEPEIELTAQDYEEAQKKLKEMEEEVVTERKRMK